MEKTYKSRVYRIILNIIYGVAAAVTLGALSMIFFSDNYLWPIVIACVTFVLYVWLVIIDTFLTITTTDKTLTVKKGHKSTTYDFETTVFSARTTSSQGETTCKLYAQTPDGKTTTIDCELIGIKQFERILEDVGLTGDKAPVAKLTTKNHKGE